MDKKLSKKYMFSILFNKDDGYKKIGLNIGIDFDNKILSADNGVIIPFNELTKILCILEKVAPNCYYIKGYFYNDSIEVTRLLHRLGRIHRYKDKFAVSKYDRTMEIDLFYPIKCLNQIIFKDKWKMKEIDIRQC